MKARALVIAAFVVLVVGGAPVGGWLWVGASACLATGAIATILSAEDIAKSAFGWSAALLVSGVMVTAVGNGLQAMLERPAVQLALVAALAGVLLLAVGLGAAKLAAAWPKVPGAERTAKPSVRTRAAVNEVVVPPTLRAADPSGPPDAPQTDDLGLFRVRKRT